MYSYTMYAVVPLLLLLSPGTACGTSLGISDLPLTPAAGAVSPQAAWYWLPPAVTQEQDLPLGTGRTACYVGVQQKAGHLLHVYTASLVATAMYMKSTLPLRTQCYLIAVVLPLFLPFPPSFSPSPYTRL